MALDNIAADESPLDVFEALSQNLDSKEKAAPSKETKETETEETKDTELDLKFLDDESEEEPESEEETEDTEEEPEETDELKLDEEKPEDELELAKIPKMKDIEAAYPGILKKFPALRNSFYRERAFSEVFPTVQDAKDAKESIEQFNEVQGELLSGNIEGTLQRVKATNEKAFNKIAAGILDSLVKVDPNSHLGVTRQVTKGVLNYLYTAASNTLKKDPNNKQAEQLQIATELIHDALYNTREVTPDQVQRVIEQEDPERAKFNAERESFEKSRYTTAFNSVSSKINNVLTNAVSKEIDPRSSLPPYVKSNLVKDVMAECDRQLMGDKPFRNLIDKMWLNAKNNNYSDESLTKIQTALKQKAATILPGIMRAKKSEALKGLGSVKKKDNARELSRTSTGEKTTRERATLSRRSNDDKPHDDESALDYLNRKLG